MMKRILAILLVLVMVFSLCACDTEDDSESSKKKKPSSSQTSDEEIFAGKKPSGTEPTGTEPTTEPTEPTGTEPTEPTSPAHIDYAGQLKLDQTSNRAKLEVQWSDRSHIDGDTSHFVVPSYIAADGIIKARLLAVDTPESTGQIEAWGKTASNFTKEKLSAAHSIIIEAEDATWNCDENGSYLVWVWYQPTADADYRCLNIELLQNGLGGVSLSAGTIYDSVIMEALTQAAREKLYLFSDERDPDFPYNEVASVTLKELRINTARYEGMKVAVEGIITYNSNYEAYIECYDAEDDMYYGMMIFYGYDSRLISVLAVGNQVRVVGVLSEFYGVYQISSLTYNPMKPENPANTAILSTGNQIAYTEVNPTVFTGYKLVRSDGSLMRCLYADIAMATTISMKNLKVESVYTTTSPSAGDVGAMTLTCSANGVTISVRTAVLKHAAGNLITADYFEGRTIDIRGIVDYYDGSYQIRVFSINDIVIH